VRVRALAAQRQAAAERASARAFRARLVAADRASTRVVHGKRAAAKSTGTAAPNPTAGTAIAAARSRLGDPYVWGAEGPSSFDCSGLTQWAYARAGVSLPRVAADQWRSGPRVSLADLAPGDLLFWATDTANPATIHHVALYLGDGTMIAAPHTGTVVQVQRAYWRGFVGAVRPTATQ
jgi:cell wall-associated NlpC family hydrolase